MEGGGEGGVRVNPESLGLAEMRITGGRIWGRKICRGGTIEDAWSLLKKKTKQSSKKKFTAGVTNKCENHLHKCDNQSHNFG